MQIMWHGKKGPHVSPKDKDNCILTVTVEPGKDAAPGRSIKLMAGINDDIAPDDWKEALKSPAVKHFFEAGYLEVVDATIKDKPVAKAESMVKETIDRKLLAKWRAAESRAEVVSIIDKHVAEMDKKPPKPA